MKPQSDGPSEIFRKTAASRLLQLFDLWQLDQSDRLGLLGLRQGDDSQLQALERDELLPDDTEMLNRISVVFSIDHSLNALYPENPEMVCGWMTMSNGVFDYRKPLDVIKSSKDGLFKVRIHLDERLQTYF